MADKQSSMTKTHQDRLSSRTYDLGGGPFGVMRRVVDEMDRTLDDFGFGRHLTSGPWSQMGLAWAPDVEVFQKKEELTIRVDLPGLKKDEVAVNITDDAVTIQGERKHEHEEQREGFYKTERSYGSFFRTIPLPEGAMSDQAKAEYRDGVLEIRLPAPPASRGRRLEITESAKR